MIFVDTNYFVRLIENDNTVQVKIVEDLFVRGAEGKEKLVSSVVVFFEIYWLMRSFYEKRKENLVTVLKDILDMSFIKWENVEILTNAVSIMEITDYDLEDAYNVVYAKKNSADGLGSFDKKLQNIWKKI